MDGLLEISPSLFFKYAKSPHWIWYDLHGDQSIFWYEQWLETADRSILQDIINYNEDDVRATAFLHEWLSNYK